MWDFFGQIVTKSVSNDPSHGQVRKVNLQYRSSQRQALVFFKPNCQNWHAMCI